MSLINLKIGGMTCINCKTKIENALVSLEGIRKADVSWEKGRADIEYDEEKINLNEIQKIIESLDYKVENSKYGNKKKTLSRLLINISYLIIIALLFLILRDFKLGVEMGNGTNVIEFTPEKTGDFKYTCWMGMINGKIKVVE